MAGLQFPFQPFFHPICVDISIQILINECMQLSPWSPSFNPCTSKKLEEVELRWPGKQVWHFLVWLHKLKIESLFFYFLHVIASMAWMCTNDNKTNKWVKKVSVEIEKELSVNLQALAEERGIKKQQWTARKSTNVEITQFCFMMKKKHWPFRGVEWGKGSRSQIGKGALEKVEEGEAGRTLLVMMPRRWD